MRRKTVSPLLPYEKKWVALTPDGKRVVAAGRDVEAVDKKLRKLKIKKGEAVLTYVPPFDAYLSM